MDLKPWLNALTRALQTPEGAPDDHTIRTLLDLARDAAHEIERPAAPLTTFLVGVAVGRGATLDAAASTASALLLDATEPPEPPPADLTGEGGRPPFDPPVQGGGA